MFHWKQHWIETREDIVSSLVSCVTKAEAEEFFALYSGVNPHAAHNVGYMTGYMSHEDADRIRDWLGVEHPIFGKTHPKQCIKIGMRIGELSRLHGIDVAMKMVYGDVAGKGPWHLGALD